MSTDSWVNIEGAPFEYDPGLQQQLDDLHGRVQNMRAVGRLTRDSLPHIANLFRIKNIYHSNAIEGNLLDQGETRLVVESGLTISGKSLRDQAEARNLNAALDYLEELVGADRAVGQTDVRQVHRLILSGIDDAGAGSYRTGQVKISGSEYDPPSAEKVPPDMTAFSDWLASQTQENTDTNPIAVAAAAHAWFAQIHPFVDGNGRTARIIMNLLLMRNGYPIAIVEKEERARYYDALEESQSSNLSPFISLIAESVEDSLEAYEQAAEEERRRGEWLAEVSQRLAEPERIRLSNEYEVWTRAMDLFRESFRVTANELYSGAGGMFNVYFKEFGMLDMEKFMSLRKGLRAKRTWLFRLDLRRGNESARYLFFFGYGKPLGQTSQDRPVNLLVSREDPPNSFNYVQLRDITSPDVPTIFEVGYDLGTERFYVITQDGRHQESNVEQIVRDFVSEVARVHFG